MELVKLKKSYKQYGYCIKKNFIDIKSIQKIKKFTQNIKKTKPKPNQIMKYYENSIL